MITIIKDRSGKYVSSKNSIVVQDLASYFLARKNVLSLRKSSEDFEVVVKKKNYFDFFMDFEEYEDIEVKIFEPTTEIREEELAIFPSNLFKALIANKEPGIDLKHRIEGKFFQSYPAVLKAEFQKDVDSFIEVLVEGIIFSKYESYNFRSIMEDEYSETYDFFKNNEELHKNFTEAKFELKEYIERINQLLKINQGKIQCFAAFSSRDFISKVSGDLNYEKEFYLSRTLEEMNYLKNYSELKENLTKFKEKFKADISDIEELIKNLETAMNIDFKEINSLTEWQEFFKGEYTQFSSCFSQENLEKDIAAIERKYKATLTALRISVKNLWNSANENFGEYYKNNYNSLHSSVERKGLDYALSENYKYLNPNKKTLLIFIDCLRYDIWKGIRKSLEERNYICQKENILLSSIPTVTSYCKKILYFGKKYNQIEGSDYMEGLKSNLSVPNLIKVENAAELLENLDNSDTFLYEILDLDNFFHNIKDLDRQYIESSLKLKIEKMISGIDPNQFSIIIMTDHGAAKLEDEGLRSMTFREYLSQKSLEIENHGRYVKIYGRHFDKSVYDRLKEELENRKEFYCIDRESMSRYYLPPVESSRENYFYLIYKNGFYPKKTGEFNHGGISLEEVMIPFAVFSTEVKSFSEVAVEIKNCNVQKGKDSEIKLLIKNSNELTKFKIKLRYQEVFQEIDFLDGNKLLQLPINIGDRTGVIRDILDVEFYFGEAKKELKIPIEIIIEENKVEEFNKKMKRSRSLL